MMSDQNETMDFTSREDFTSMPTVFPTLVVGVGGTGVKALRHLRRRLKDEFGPSSKEASQLVQLLGVDTVPLENRSSVEALHQHEYAYIGGFDAERVIKNIDRFPEIKRWWDWDPDRVPLGFISTGAKQIRTIGRLSLYRRFHTYESRVESKINRLASIDAHQISHAIQRRPSQDQIHLPHVFIVASLAGGTGAGAFLDIAAHLRNRLRAQTRIFGVLVMPSVFEEDIPSLLQQRRIRANAYAALKELDFFQSGKPFVTKFPERDLFELRGGIFTSAFLLDRSNATGFQLSTQSDVHQLIADAVFEMAVTPTAGHIWEMDANVTRELDDGHPLSYSAMGYSSIVVDDRSRFYRDRGVHARMVWEAALGGHTEDTAIVNVAHEVIRQIEDKAGSHSRGMSESGANPQEVYSKKMKDECHRIILDTLAAKQGAWGVNGMYRFVTVVNHHFSQLVDSGQAETKSAGQLRQEALEKELKQRLDKVNQTAPKTGKRILNIFGNTNTPTPQEIIDLQAAQTALADTRAKLDRYILIRAGVAPDVSGLLRTLADNLTVCYRELESAGYGLEQPAPPPLSAYPLQTRVAPEYDDTANNLQDAGAVNEASGNLLAEWITFNYSAANNAPIIQWNYSQTEYIRSRIGDVAYYLTRTQALNRSSLYRALLTMSQTAPEYTHDMLRDFIRRCVPYIRLDFDGHNFSEKNIEPENRICIPADLMTEYDKQGNFFWALSTGDYEFHPASRPNHRSDRMDALCIAHGYKVNVFADLPAMFTQYISKDLGSSPLHLECRWRKLMRYHDIHILTAEEKKLQDDREPDFQKLCSGPGGGRQATSSPDRPSTPRPSSGTTTIDK